MTLARRVIKITAMDSPNVRLALEQQRLGLPVTGVEIIPGVLSWQLYQQRRATWDAIRQCVGLDGEFYEGAELNLYPPEWLNRAAVYAASLNDRDNPAQGMGVDSAEGGDNTTWAVTGHKGLKRLISIKTPDTSVITSRTLALMNEYQLEPEQVMFDQGGGGKEHADRLRLQGYDVGSLSFGESVAPEPVVHMRPFEDKLEDRRERHTFKNRRAQMYWLLRQRVDPGTGNEFAIGAEHVELRRQLNAMPLLWDEEGRFMMLPKRRRYNGSIKQDCLEDRLGCSPDEADALVLAVFAMDHGGVTLDMSPIY